MKQPATITHTRLPAQVPNEMGVRGGIEYGFSSTTTERETALQYAGTGEQREASTIFEMQMGEICHTVARPRSCACNTSRVAD